MLVRKLQAAAIPEAKLMVHSEQTREFCTNLPEIIKWLLPSHIFVCGLNKNHCTNLCALLGKKQVRHTGSKATLKTTVSLGPMSQDERRKEEEMDVGGPQSVNSVPPPGYLETRTHQANGWPSLLVKPSESIGDLSLPGLSCTVGTGWPPLAVVEWPLATNDHFDWWFG